MSTDWNIKCLDCDSIHRFNDANHEDGLMRALIEHADAIAAIGPLLASNYHHVSFATHYGMIDTAWFAAHKGHKLKPIDEYGRLDDQCHKHIACVCGNSRACVLDAGHTGDHSPT